jgi:quinol-cytochrome oxidoreductase complex cytochrome b subunit
MSVIRFLSPTRLSRATIEWVDRRTGLREFVATLLDVTIPRSAHTFYLGGLTLFSFAVQVTTGILLTLYYQGTPDNAYSSVLYVMNEVNFGWLVRSVHAWGANLMIIFCILHMLRVVVQGAFKNPREITWMAGMLLLFVTLGFGFTGYLLPWDQRAYWATVVGTEIVGAVPVIGNFILEFLRGGPEVGPLTLSRFYGVHTLVLPIILGALLTVHLFLIHQQGLADPEGGDEE